jgi:hypothetical protein
MYHPAAIREDHDPFDILRSAPTFLQLFGFVHWSTYRCPHCSVVFRTDYWPDSVRLGCGERACRQCGNVFDDGTREWPQLLRQSKTEILCSSAHRRGRRLGCLVCPCYPFPVVGRLAFLDYLGRAAYSFALVQLALRLGIPIHSPL